jgi:N-acyl-D-amino-acid deacylase
MAYSLVIKNGRIVDGTGRPSFIADIGVEDDRITMVGRISDPGDAELIDASGKAVAPGFIEIHTHYDPSSAGTGPPPPPASMVSPPS